MDAPPYLNESDTLDSKHEFDIISWPSGMVNDDIQVSNAEARLISTTSMVDPESNSATVTTLPIGADKTSGSRKAGSSLKAISSLRPILKLMNIYFDETEWRYDRNLKWDIVLARTAEVEQITINNTEEAIPPAVYMHIPRPGGTHLFPNLARLRLVNEPLHSSLYHLPLLVSPRLHSLEIDNISQDDIPGLDYFLQDPDLQESLINVVLGPIQYSPRILHAISQCKSVEIATLTFLSSKPLHHDGIRLLGNTPRLQSLIIKAGDVPYASTDPYNAVPAGFVALRDICIIGAYLLVEAILAAAGGGAAIRTLNVTISRLDCATGSGSPFCQTKPKKKRGITLPPMIDTSLSVVANKWSSSLDDFILAVDLGTQGMHPTLLRESIGHLTKLSGLRRLVVRGFRLNGLNDLLKTEITKLGGSLWPNIEEIQFPILLGDQSPDMETTISLSTFCHLVQHCTNLLSFCGLIALPPVTDDLSEAFDKNPIQSGLKQLSTGSVHTTQSNRNMLRTARLLEKLCPKLDKLITHAEYSPTTWDNIFEAMAIFKEVREEGAALRNLGAN